MALKLQFYPPILISSRRRFSFKMRAFWQTFALTISEKNQTTNVMPTTLITQNIPNKFQSGVCICSDCPRGQCISHPVAILPRESLSCVSRQSSCNAKELVTHLQPSEFLPFVFVRHPPLACGCLSQSDSRLLHGDRLPQDARGGSADTAT